ncbi:MAG: hypothetical protein ACK5H2_04310 [Beutenbergiaceae bacterium]
MIRTEDRSLISEIEGHVRGFPGQVGECGGWVVRVLSVDADGGSFEILAIPEGFTWPEPEDGDG